MNAVIGNKKMCPAPAESLLGEPAEGALPTISSGVPQKTARVDVDPASAKELYQHITYALRPIGGAAARQRPPARLCYASTRGKSLTSPASILHFTCYERTPPAAPRASRKSRLQAPRRETQSW